MQSLMKEKDYFKAQQGYIYIYIYMKVDKGVGESGNACEESCKAPCKNTSKPPFLEKGFFWKKIIALLKTVY